MAEQFADPVEGNPLPEQVRGKSVAEKVCSFSNGIDSRVYQRPPHDRRNCNGVRKTPQGSPVSKEHPATGTARSAKAQIECDSLTDIVWQWQLC